MIRREQVHPNEQGEVTLDALIEAAIRGCTFLDFAGGTISIVVERQPTGFPGEMFTTKAAMEWRHDARVEPKPQQFEAPTAKAQWDQNLSDRQVAEMREEDPRVGEAQRLAEEQIEAVHPGHVVETVHASNVLDVDPADGFDYSKLDEEDVEEPVAAS